MRILHIINSLQYGGAQSVLADLVTHWDNGSDEQMVMSLLSGGPLVERLREAGIPVTSLARRPAAAAAAGMLRLPSMLRTFKPDIVQTWLYHTSLIGSLVVRMVSSIPVIWGIHHTLAGRQSLSTMTWGAVRLLARLSARLPAAIICCSQSALTSHASHGFSPAKLRMIENGVDTEYFAPDAAASGTVRRELGLSPERKLVGMFARFHPQKDHATLISAAAQLRKSESDVHFVLAGDGVDAQNAWLRNRLHEEAVEGAFHLLGPRRDMRRLYAAMDIVTLSSADGEALPRTVAEAMSCGRPCAATDVGDTANLIGDTGLVVPPHQPGQLAAAWQKLLALPQAEQSRLSVGARQRILTRYGLPLMVDRYRHVYKELTP